MNDNKFFYLFNDIDDSYIEEADDARAERVYLEQKHLKFKQGLGIAAGAAACFAILAGAVYLSSGGKSLIDTHNPSNGQLAPGTVITEDGYKMFTDEHGNTVKVKNTDHREDTLQELTRDNIDEINYWVPGESGKLFKQEGVPDEIFEAYRDAQRLDSKDWFGEIYFYAFMPELIVCKDGGEMRYSPTGFSYDSFYSVMSSIYTKESLDQMLTGDRYYEFCGELWCSTAPPIRSNFIVGTNKAYEVTVNTDNEFAFTTTYYILSAWDSILSSTSIESRFVKTDEGWRAVSIDLGGISSLDSFKTEEPDNSKDVPAAEDDYKTFTDEHGNTVRLKGEPMEPGKLWSFGTVQPYDVRDEDGLNDFFINEGIPDEICQTFLLASDFSSHLAFVNIGYADENESTDDFMKRLSVTFLADPENKIMYVPNFIPGFDTELIVSRNGKQIHYRETGFSYDSFFEALCSAYTKESAAQMIEKGDMYYEYGGELWCADLAFRYNNNNILSREYKLITYTDTEFVFSTTYERYASFEEYNFPYTQTVEHRLVKTDDGWRLVWSPYLRYDRMYTVS